MVNQALRICLGLLLIVVSVPVRADDLEQTVAELRERIEALEKQQVADSKTFKLYWKEGIRYDTLDNAFQMRIGGRIQNDWAFFDQDSGLEDAVGNWDDGTEFRRARLYMQELLYETIEFKAQYDFAGGDINGGELDDVTVGLNWYLNPNTRVMLNYVYADASDLYDGETHIFQTRFQIDF
jgi:phosphate-selective porin